MPTYEYSCQKCGAIFEVFQSMRDAPLEVCTCGKKGRVKRLVGRGAGIIFKGSGFYETDYKRRPAPHTKGEKSDSQGPAKGATPSIPPAKGDAHSSAGGGASKKN